MATNNPGRLATGVMNGGRNGIFFLLKKLFPERHADTVCSIAAVGTNVPQFMKAESSPEIVATASVMAAWGLRSLPGLPPLFHAAAKKTGKKVAPAVLGLALLTGCWGIESKNAAAPTPLYPPPPLVLKDNTPCLPEDSSQLNKLRTVFARHADNLFVKIPAFLLALRALSQVADGAVRSDPLAVFAGLSFVAGSIMAWRISADPDEILRNTPSGTTDRGREPS